MRAGVGAVVAGVGEQGVDLRVQLIEDPHERLLVLLEQQATERVGQVGIADGLDEGRGQPHRRDRIAARRHVQRHRQRGEAGIHFFQRLRVALVEDLTQPLPGQMEIHLAFVDQAQLGAALRAHTDEVVEAQPDLLAEPHHVARAMLAQHQQRRLVM